MTIGRPRWVRILWVRLRRGLGRLDRAAPAWLFWLPSWGTSLVIHGLALFVLAVGFLASSGPGRAPSEIDSALLDPAAPDFSMITMADHAGDPLGDNRPIPELAPSIGPPAVGVDLSSKVEDSAFTAMDRPAPELPVSERWVGRLPSAFAGRTLDRGERVRREGGTTESERAVELGLGWLARHQRGDGGWSLDVHSECKGNPACPEGPPTNSDTAATGLALLTYLAAGHTYHRPGPYQDQVQRAIGWLLRNQQKTGELFTGGMGDSRMYSHAIASMALCEAYGIMKDRRLEMPAKMAVAFIAQAQHKTGGGWRYEPGMRGDTSVFGWQMFALRSAAMAGLAVPKTVLTGCNLYLDQASMNKELTDYSYQGRGGSSPVMTAEALLCRQYLGKPFGWPRDRPALIKGVAGVWDDLQGNKERNIYYWYYATQLLHNMQNDAWKRWNPMIRDGLVKTQVISKGCDNGSWSPDSPQPDRWGTRAGRLFQTTMSILTLEVYYRYLPLYRTNDRQAMTE